MSNNAGQDPGRNDQVKKQLETLGSFIMSAKKRWRLLFPARSEGSCRNYQSRARLWSPLSHIASRTLLRTSNFEETALGIYRYWRHFVRQNGEGDSWPYIADSHQRLPKAFRSESHLKAAGFNREPSLFTCHGLADRDGSEIIPKIAKTHLPEIRSS